MSVSPALQFQCNRLDGLSTGVFRLEAQNATSNLPAQSVIRVTLPSNSLCDLHSTAFHFDASTTSGAAGLVGCRLPNKIETMINRVAVSIGGVEVAAGANFYNILCHIKDVVNGNWMDDYGMNHPTIISTVGTAGLNYISGNILTNEEVTGAVGREAFYCVDNWYGFLGECQPRVLDSALVGDIVITIFLEQPNLCLTMSDDFLTDAGFITSVALGGAVPNYTVNNVYFTIRCYNLADGAYDNMIASIMASNPRGLEMGFKQYASFRDLNTGASRFSLSTQSLDAIYVAHHANVSPSGATSAPVNQFGGPQIVTGSLPQAVPGMATLGYMHPYTQFAAPAAPAGQATEYQFQLNGATFPMYRMTRNDVYQVLRLAGQYDYRNKDYGFAQYTRDHFVSAIKLTLDAYSAREIQGLNCRGISLNGFYNIFNAVGNTHITLMAEMTSSLFIDAGRQISVVT
jgi:hypothetical protein